MGTTTDDGVNMLQVNGNIKADKILARDGTAAAPAYTFTNDPDTGIYSPGANTIGFSAAGAEAARISAGEVLIATSTDAGDYKLQVNGNAYFHNDVSALSFTDRTPAPENLAESYAIVESHEVKNKELNHSKLHPAAWGKKTRVSMTGRMKKRMLDDGAEIEEPEIETVSEPDPDGRNLSITITAQSLVIKDLIKRIEALENKK